MFLGEMRMGLESKILDLVFDTGSDWLVVPDVDCVNCDGQKFDNSESEVVNDELSERLYGSAALLGSTYRTKVCLGSSSASCV